MSVISDIKDELEDYRTARLITGALRDISATRLQIVRKKVEESQLYYKEIEELYRLIKRHALKEGLALTSREEGAPPRVLSVAITSNKRFYGTLNSDVMDEFTKDIKDDPNHDHVVVGHTGRQYIKDTPYAVRCKHFEFSEDEPNPHEVVLFLDTTRSYDNVLMYYPKFVNVFKQSVTVTDVTYVAEPSKDSEITLDYIFEPELKDIFWFFETQVRYILFTQVMLEIELARTSARLLKMNAAEQNADEAIGKTHANLRKLETSLDSMHLLEMYSRVAQWSGKAHEPKRR